ncbi:hypothetical protein PaG_03359 [Moesziomyces aphidis]|uniref:V-type proton ATPase subunit G n=1 Tax=Moesziomyces aphidis TaxID=84754 RepID=W3VKW2_MOEAP|nr:hypothetical protein PaG_03359 [Moesziomyces aphidis]
MDAGAVIAVAASSPSYTSAWQLLFDFAHRHRHPIHHEKLAKKLMLRGNTRSVQGKLSDWIALELGSGMSNLRIGDRNARSHAPSAGAAQPAHSPLAHCISSPHLLHPCASPLPQPNHLGPIPTPFDRHPLVHSSTRPLPRLASHRIAIRLDCIRPLPLLHYGEIPAQPATTQQCHDFDAAQQSQGIQTLLEAEKEAAKIVQKARTYRTQKLKDARNEASKEIEQLKANKEKEFADFQKQHEGSTNSSQTTVDKETEERLGELNKAFEANRDQVISKLLDRVVDVKTELHRNLQLQQKA